MPAAARRWMKPAPTDSAAASSAARASSCPPARSASQASSPSGGSTSGSGQQPASSASDGSGGGSQPASPGTTKSPASPYARAPGMPWPAPTVPAGLPVPRLAGPGRGAATGWSGIGGSGGSERDVCYENDIALDCKIASSFELSFDQ